MNKIIRQNKILCMLKRNEELSIPEMADMLNVAEMTIRRDIKEMKDNGLVNQGYGWVSAVHRNQKSASDYNVVVEQSKMDREKELIGKCAATLLSPHDFIIIDTGSTAERLVKYIDPSIELTVLCYNYNVLSQLVHRSNINIIMSGGYYHPKDQTFESDEGLSLIQRLRANKLFISASGIHKSLGMTCSNNYEVLSKQSILKSSQSKILMADSSKFGKVCTAYFADLTDIDTIITDKGIPEDWKSHCESLGIKVMIADEDETYSDLEFMNTQR